MSQWYNPRRREREFHVGDKVLVLFSVVTHPLQARFQGPDTVRKKIDSLNYVIETPDWRKPTQLVHVNMMKGYHDTTPAVVGAAMKTDEVEGDGKEGPERFEKIGIVPTRLENSVILASLADRVSHLEPEQREQIIQLINRHTHLCPDVPRRCSGTKHDVIVTSTQPIKQAPYRMNSEKNQLVEKEIEHMLAAGIIRESSSAWASPCVVVPKPDGTIRFCTDYRKVNAVTQTDALIKWGRREIALLPVCWRN
ncbi:uncharacterized protein LOC132399087 [Hypanus sabinus]|uniref:uncharacterized protein LOC132399087 n=1 Tax=Hypanus sabinus TaxID=79690 RepID=UPI0028C4B234|nr:uncharacterized protein LOC132399087 [Hypanus sabinus]